jgi:hypothetical protein
VEDNNMIDSWISPILSARKEPAAHVQLPVQWQPLFVFVVALTLKHPDWRSTPHSAHPSFTDIDV